jgi:crotonobetainyl-CoA:carnitine CoA-transferase CaiB-like acyl-CoA transferase
MFTLLKGVKVVSSAWMYPGPYCTMLLADMGAEVIILERPKVGDLTRLDPYFFEAINRNKKSITVNLRSEKGREICYKLVQKSDVFLDGFRPGVAQRLGIDYATLEKLNPALVYISISGYGQDGPYANWPGHDISYQGIAGMLAQHEAREEEASLPPLAMADLSAGMFATIGVLAALHHRSKTGQGMYIDVSMVDGLMSWMTVPLTIYLNSGLICRSREPAWGIFKARDGRCLTMSIAYEDHFWSNLCHLLGTSELASMPREERIFRREELVTRLKETFLTKTRDEWVQILTSGNVAAGPVYNYSEVVNDPHLKHRHLFIEIEKAEKKLKEIAFPLKFPFTSQQSDLYPPELGEHNEEILSLLGYTEKQIDEFRRNGVI